MPRIVVGFRSREGVLRHLEEIDTAGIPATAARRGRAGWDGNACINFASAFLACEFTHANQAWGSLEEDAEVGFVESFADCVIRGV